MNGQKTKFPLSQKESYTVTAKPFSGMGFLLFCFLPVFLMNPEFGIIDFIPDFIGYAILLVALSKLRDVSEKFEECMKKITVAALISVAKLVSLFLSFGVLSQGEGGSDSSQMLFSLVFCTLEFIFVVPTLRSFFEAIHSSGVAHSCEYIYEERRSRRGRTKSDRTSNIKNFTTVFLIVRSLAAMLPQLSVASSHGFDETAFDFSVYRGMFMTVSAFVTVVFSVIWLCKVYPYFIALGKQKEFKENLKAAYIETTKTSKSRFIIRNTSTFGLILTVGAYFGCDLLIEGNSKNALPDVIMAVLMITAVSLSVPLLRNCKKLATASLAVFAGFAITSIIKESLRFDFFSSHTLFAYYRNPTAYALYNKFSLVYVIDAILLSLSFFLVCSLIKYIERGYAISKLSLEIESSARMTLAESKEFSKSYILPVKVMAVIAPLLTALYPFVLRLSATTFSGVSDETMNTASFIVGLTATYWILDFAASLILAVTLTRALSALKDRIETKLMLD